MKNKTNSGLRRVLAFVLAVCMMMAFIVPAGAAETDARGAIESALSTRTEQLDLSAYDVSPAEFESLFTQILEDEPAKYWYVVRSYSTTTSASVVSSVTFQYLDEETYSPAAFTQAVDFAIHGAILNGMSDLEAALALHDYLALHVAYDSTYGKNTGFDALVNGSAVDQGYAQAYEVLLDAAGIDSVLVSGSGKTWNLVALDGKWYHVDVTADDPSPDASGRVIHDYFLLSDDGITAAGRSGWTADFNCTDETYDTGAYWTQANSPIVFTAAGTGYYRADSDTEVKILRHTDGTATVYTKAIPGISVSDSAMVYPSTCGLSLWEDSLYFTDGTAVYALPLDGDTASAVHTHDTDDGNYIYGSHVENGQITMALFSAKTLDLQKSQQEKVSSTAHSHTYSTTEVAPGCTAEGYTLYSCSCGDSFRGTQSVAAPGHSWQDASCTEPRTCSRCGITDGNALGHTTELRNVAEVTCSTDGYTGDEVCTVCEKTVTTGEVIPATGHTTELQDAKDATCTAEGYTGDLVCTVCKKVVEQGQTLAKTEHTVSSWTVMEATCDTDGSKTGTCSSCDQAITTVIPATGHTVSKWNITKEATCDTDGEQTGYCSTCEKDVTEVIPAGHKWDSGVTVNATCDTDGSTTWTCTVCEQTKVETVPATGHTMGGWLVTAPADCDTIGIESCACANCDYTETRQIPALGHSWSDWTVTVESTCTTDGEESRTCSVCDETETQVIAAPGHTWNEGTVTKEPTCTATGEKQVTCTVCDAAETQAIPAAGHKTNLVGEREATCTDAGYTGDEVCVNCDVTISEGQWVSATGHTTELQNVAEATCTAPGYTGDEVCTVCGAVVTEGEEIAETPHDVELLNAVQATCMAGGYTGDEVCADCGLVLAKGKDTPITDHAWSLWTEGKTEGRLERKCAYCGDVEYMKAENPFTDVKDGEYYYDPVIWAVANNITAGTTDTTFSPDATCTRAQVVTFLWRAFGSPKPVTTKNPFTDVKAGAYYYDAVLWAVENNITSGTTKDTFSPNSGCTRAQVVSFLHRAAGRPDPTAAKNPFTDVKAGAYYYDAVLWAVENKITSGVSANKFAPEATCTRGQIVSFLYRYLNG